MILKLHIKRVLPLLGALLLCGCASLGPSKEIFPFENGKYLVVWKDGETNEPVNGYELLISNKKGVVKFTDPRYGDFTFDGNIKHNKFWAYYKVFSDRFGEKGLELKSSTFSQLLKWLTFGTLIQTPYTECEFKGALVGKNKLAGQYASSDSKGNSSTGKFEIFPSSNVARKIKYKNLPVGKGVGAKITSLDPRRIVIHLDNNGQIKVDEKILDVSKLKERINIQTGKYGNDIPMVLYVDKNVKFIDIKKLFKTLEECQVYRCRFDYFRDKEWDGLTCYQFDLNTPGGKPVTIPEEHLIKIVCMPSQKYTINGSKLGFDEVNQYFKKLGQDENYKVIFLDIDNNVPFKDLIKILEKSYYYKLKVKFHKALSF